MASLNALPADQRAVLDLVLQRGRSYDDIAALLAIDRAGVRARALAAFDELGPDTGVSPERRALITDYLLGQLPDRVAEQTRERLGESAGERAWARAIASELGPLASKPLPEIPANSAGGSTAPVAGEPAARAAVEGGPGAAPAPIAAEPRPPRPRRSRSRSRSAREPKRERTGGSFLNERPSSRLGGALILLVGVVAVVVVVVLVAGGGSKRHNSTATDTHAASGSTTSAGTSTGTSSTKTATPQVVAQINLNPPSGSGSTKGVAFVVKEGTAFGIIIQATGVAPNSHNAYAAWLSNTPTDSVRLGFVTPGVGKTGALQTGGALPTNAAHYKELLLTLETSSNPKTPGTIVLEGPFKGVP